MSGQSDENAHKPKTTRQVVRDVLREHTCWHDPSLPDQMEAAVERLIEECVAQSLGECGRSVARAYKTGLDDARRQHVEGSGYCPDACTWPHDHRFVRDGVPWPARVVSSPGVKA